MTGLSRRGNTQTSRAEALAEVWLFDGCSRKELAHVAKMAKLVEVESGAIVCEEGRLGHQFFVVLEGTAAVVRGTGANARHLRRIGPGAAFGELALLDARPRTATVRATTAMRLLVLDPAQFTDLIDRVPSVGHKLLTTLAWRLRGAEQEIDRLKATNSKLRGADR